MMAQAPILTVTLNPALDLSTATDEVVSTSPSASSVVVLAPRRIVAS